MKNVALIAIDMDGRESVAQCVIDADADAEIPAFLRKAGHAERPWRRITPAEAGSISARMRAANVVPMPRAAEMPADAAQVMHARLAEHDQRVEARLREVSQGMADIALPMAERLEKRLALVERILTDLATKKPEAFDAEAWKEFLA